MTALLAAAVVLAAAAGTALAARPGGALYEQRIWIETLTLPNDPSARAIAELARLDARLREAEDAARAGDFGRRGRRPGRVRDVSSRRHRNPRSRHRTRSRSRSSRPASAATSRCSRHLRSGSPMAPPTRSPVPSSGRSNARWIAATERSSGSTRAGPANGGNGGNGSGGSGGSGAGPDTPADPTAKPTKAPTAAPTPKPTKEPNAGPTDPGAPGGQGGENGPKNTPKPQPTPKRHAAELTRPAAPIVVRLVWRPCPPDLRPPSSSTCSAPDRRTPTAPDRRARPISCDPARRPSSSISARAPSPGSRHDWSRARSTRSW